MLRVCKKKQNKMKQEKKEAIMDEPKGDPPIINSVKSDKENYVGKEGTPAAQNWKGIIKNQRIIPRRGLTDFENDDTILIVEFENGFCCNAEAVLWE